MLKTSAMNQFQLESSDLAQSFIRKLLYFDIFSHPLTAKEIFDFCDAPLRDQEFAIKVLNQLVDYGLVNVEDGFYYLGNDRSKVKDRLAGNYLAGIRMKDAHKYSAIVAAFPYVRGVFISGSLSKHVMKPDSDIDFFIITEPDRLWICRAFLTLYKKLILKNSHRNFCLNYFIDSKNLEIPDKNIFTATEIAFLLPMYNFPLYQEFMDKNDWIHDEFPNFIRHTSDLGIKPSALKSRMEKIFNNRVGQYLDELSYSIIVGFWKKKFRYMGEKRFNLNLRSQKNVSKHHPNAFQERVVHKYAEKIMNFERLNDFDLSEAIKIKSLP